MHGTAGFKPNSVVYEVIYLIHGVEKNASHSLVSQLGVEVVSWGLINVHKCMYGVAAWVSLSVRTDWGQSDQMMGDYSKHWQCLMNLSKISPDTGRGISASMLRVREAV